MVTFSMFVIFVVLENMGLILPVAKVLLPCDKQGERQRVQSAQGCTAFGVWGDNYSGSYV